MVPCICVVENFVKFNQLSCGRKCKTVSIEPPIHPFVGYVDSHVRATIGIHAGRGTRLYFRLQTIQRRSIAMKQHHYTLRAIFASIRSTKVLKLATRVMVIVVAGIGFSAVVAGCASTDIGSTSPSATSTQEHPDHPTGKDHPSKGDHPDHPSNGDHPDHPSNGDHPDHPSNGDHPDHPSNGDHPDHPGS